MKNGVIVETMMISRTERKPAFSIRMNFRYPQLAPDCVAFGHHGFCGSNRDVPKAFWDVS
jgi:hypothetical protein